MAMSSTVVPTVEVAFKTIPNPNSTMWDVGLQESGGETLVKKQPGSGAFVEFRHERKHGEVEDAEQDEMRAVRVRFRDENMAAKIFSPPEAWPKFAQEGFVVRPGETVRLEIGAATGVIGKMTPSLDFRVEVEPKVKAGTPDGARIVFDC